MRGPLWGRLLVSAGNATGHHEPPSRRCRRVHAKTSICKEVEGEQVGKTAGLDRPKVTEHILTTPVKVLCQIFSYF